RAVDRRFYRRVAEVEPSLVEPGMAALKGGYGFVALGAQHGELLRRRGQDGLVAAERGLLAAQIRLRLLRALHGADAGFGEIGITRVILLRKGQRGPGRGDVGVGLAYRRLLLVSCASILRISASAAATSAWAWSSAAR